jgi:hypothetical protein
MTSWRARQDVYGVPFAPRTDASLPGSQNGPSSQSFKLKPGGAAVSVAGSTSCRPTKLCSGPLLRRTLCMVERTSRHLCTRSSWSETRETQGNMRNQQRIRM